MLIDNLEVDFVMNSKSEWGYNPIPRDSYHDNGNSPPSQGNKRQQAGNSSPEGPQETDSNNSIGNMDETGNRQDSNSPSGNKRATDEFESQFAQRRMRRRLDRKLASEQVVEMTLATSINPEATQGGNNRFSVANPPRRSCEATARKWHNISDARKKLGLKFDKKVSEKSNIKKCVQKLAASNPAQTKITSWLKVQPNH